MEMTPSLHWPDWERWMNHSFCVGLRLIMLFQSSAQGTPIYIDICGLCLTTQKEDGTFWRNAMQPPGVNIDGISFLCKKIFYM